MKSNRRRFLRTAGIAGSVSTLLPFSSRSQNVQETDQSIADYSALDKVLKQPVLKRELFPDPVIIETLELLRDRNNTLCRVRSRDGAVGVSVGHPFIGKSAYPMFNYILKRFFVGKDARDLDTLLFDAIERNLKNQGIPLNVQVAAIEFAILDMLGIIANKPAGQLIGDVQNEKIPIYLGHHYWNLRRLEPEESLELMYQDMLETNAKAVKLRAGMGDNLASDQEFAPGRSEKLIRMSRDKFGEDITLMIDGNGSYSVKEAIRLGKILEEYDYYFYEEPIPWDWYEEQKSVEQALNIPMAGGEEEFGVHAFRYLIGNEVFQVLQPDLFYYGGMIRTMQVARMVEKAGLKITPHMSRGGLGFVYLLQMVSVCPATARFHEFKLFETPDANGTMIPIDTKGDPFKSANGEIDMLTGSGLGITIDPDYIATHKIFES